MKRIVTNQTAQDVILLVCGFPIYIFVAGLLFGVGSSSDHIVALLLGGAAVGLVLVGAVAMLIAAWRDESL